MSITGITPRNTKSIFQLTKEVMARWPLDIPIQEAACKLLAFMFHLCKRYLPDVKGGRGWRRRVALI